MSQQEVLVPGKWELEVNVKPMEGIPFQQFIMLIIVWIVKIIGQIDQTMMDIVPGITVGQIKSVRTEEAYVLTIPFTLESETNSDLIISAIEMVLRVFAMIGVVEYQFIFISPPPPPPNGQPPENTVAKVAVVAVPAMFLGMYALMGR